MSSVLPNASQTEPVFPYEHHSPRESPKVHETHPKPTTYNVSSLPIISNLTTPEILSHLSSTILPPSKTYFRNWAGSFRCRPEKLFRPDTEEQVRLIVELARREGKSLRVIGAGHSPSDLACSDGFLVDLAKLNAVFEVNHETNVVTVGGGIFLSDLHPILHYHGLALSILGSISSQSIAGAISTATHGSGRRFGNLSSLVRSLTLVIADEEKSIVHVSSSSKEGWKRDLFNASLCGLGLTGVIIRVGIECEREYKLEEEYFEMDADEFAEGFEEFAVSSEHARAWWFPQVGKVKCARANRTTKDQLINRHLHGAVLFLSRTFPQVLPFHAHLMWELSHKPSGPSFWSLPIPFFPKSPTPPQSTRTQDMVKVDGVARSTSKVDMIYSKEGTAIGEHDGDHDTGAGSDSGYVSTESNDGPIPDQLPVSDPTANVKFNVKKEPDFTVVDYSPAIFNYDCGFPQYTYEAAVPFDKAAACFRDLQIWLSTELSDPNGLRHHFPIEIRFVERDDIWLSPSYGTPVVYFGICHYKPWGFAVPYKKMFGRFEAFLRKWDGRPHWAKSHSFSRRELEGIYPMFGRFLEVREMVDKDGVFLNPYARRHIMGEVGEDVDMRRFK